MNEEPKSIWKRSWRGPSGIFLWFLLLAGAVFPVALLFGVTLGKPLPLASHLTLAGVAAIAIAVSVTLVVWFVRWVWCWRSVKRLLFIVACLVTLIALFYAEENWRGQHAWKKFKAEWEAKGERFDLAGIVPPPVPDDQNFAMAPLWVEEIAALIGGERARAWYGDKVAALGHTNFVRRLEMPTDVYSSGLRFTNNEANWQKAERMDLKPRQDYYRSLATVTNVFPVSPQPQTPAVDVLIALSKYDSTLEELRRASKLPHSRFPVGYTDENPAAILLPHLAPQKGCVQLLGLRAIAELQAGQTEKAFADVMLSLRLAETIREPFMISQLVRIAMLRIAFQPIWEGLADHQWSDAQLTALNTELGKLDFLADWQFSMRSERVFEAECIDYMKRSRNLQMLDFSLFDEQKPPNREVQAFVFRFAPVGWFEQNKAACCRMNFELALPQVDLKTRVVSPASASRFAQTFETFHPTLFNWFATLLLPELAKASQKFALAQSFTDMAGIAIALERHRLAHGTFPDTLDALAPRFMEDIPHDIIGGKPLHYRRTADSQFTLYSVGWNEKDDGGKVALTKGGSVDFQEGDWVWELAER